MKDMKLIRKSRRLVRRAVCAGLSLILVLMLMGCGKTVSVPFWNRVMTIGQMDVSYDMLRYFVMNSIYNSDTDPTLYKTDPEYQSKLEEEVYTMLRLLAAYITLADEYGLELTSEDKSNINDQLDGIQEEYGADGSYEDYLNKYYVTEDVLYQLFVIDALKSKLYDYMINEYTSPIRSDDETIRQDIADGNWFCAEYIALTRDSSSSSEDETEDTATARLESAAEEIRSRAAAGESMASLASEYQKTLGKDLVVYMDLGGYTFGRQKQYFEDQVRSLEIGAYSEVCEMPDGGYYIAHRKELDEEYIDDHFDSVFRAGYLEREIGKIENECADSLTVKIRDKYKDLEFWTME